jgi:type I protein arginine methyltransferase
MNKMQEHGFAESNDTDNKKHLIDDGYFTGYSKIAIHNEMCEDKIRVDAYEAALKASCAGKLIIDVGAGTGILSFMAADGGASKVYAIEKAGIFSKLKKEVNKRKLNDSVKVMNCLAEEAPLDGIIADGIVSEWMGSFLLSERMLPSVLAVRDKCLSPVGFLIPCTARIIIAAGYLTNI